MKNMVTDVRKFSFPLFEDLKSFKEHMQHQLKENEWDDVGILNSESNIFILLILKNQVIFSLRICLSVNETVTAIEILMKGNKDLIYGACNNEPLLQQINSIEGINIIWEKIEYQKSRINLDEVKNFFNSEYKKLKTKGRTKNICEKTKKEVMLASHGRCMFLGCGEVLTLDSLTGEEGNFYYFAHNVALSQQGPRGDRVLSKKLSNDSNNILLLCDKHHRLIDKVAAADYPAKCLSHMRTTFLKTVDELLQALSYHLIPGFAVLWPVNGQPIEAPTKRDIAQSLEPVQCRIESSINIISGNNQILMNKNANDLNKLLIDEIKFIADKILQQTPACGYKAGLFAFGPMPALIALGALLGNKAGIIPMLRHRDSGRWIWPSEKPTKKIYEIHGLEDFSGDKKEISLTIALTNEPKKLIQKRKELTKLIGDGQIIVRALPEYKGNSALAHPEDGAYFRNDMHKLLHTLADKHKVEKVHLLPCASNAACVFLGQAFDKYHPELLVYDFSDQNQTMKLHVSIKNHDNRTIVSHCNS